jgi:hypothetical protein
MKNWFNNVMALVAADRTGLTQRTDWRGRPLGNGAAKAMPPVGLAEECMYGTIHLTLFPEGSSAGPGSKNSI